MSESLPIHIVVDRVLAELQRLRYAENTLNAYRRFYNRILRYADAQAVHYYSEEFGQQFFTATYGCAWPELPRPRPMKYRAPVRFLESLSDMQLHGTVLRSRPCRKPFETPAAFRGAFDAFAAECRRRGYSITGERTRRDRIRLFVAYLGAQQVTLDTLTARRIPEYVATLMDYHPKTVLAILTNLRTFLRFLHDAGCHPEDLRSARGVVSAYRACGHRTPSTGCSMSSTGAIALANGTTRFCCWQLDWGCGSGISKYPAQQREVRSSRALGPSKECCHR